MSSAFVLRYYNVFLQDTPLIASLDLTIPVGACDVLMGPNGSGKSTLALSLMGHPAYRVQGEFFVDEISVIDVSIDKRAKAGLFLSFQQPIEIPGVSVASFLKASYEALYGPIEPQQLKERVFIYFRLLELDESFYYRNVHEGFSGGQKKKFEIVQLLLLKPKIAILDEIDSGLDVDALKIVARAISYARQENPQLTILLITHYQRILSYLSIDKVHLLMNGTLMKSGDATLASCIEQYGYDQVCACTTH